MNITFGPESSKFIQEKVDSGEYFSAEHLLHEAIKLLKLHDDFPDLHLHALRCMVEEGLRDVHAGNTIDGKEVTVASIRAGVIRRCGDPTKRPRQVP
jgi:putative addiction module CopG family antidote